MFLWFKNMEWKVYWWQEMIFNYILNNNCFYEKEEIIVNIIPFYDTLEFDVMLAKDINNQSILCTES